MTYEEIKTATLEELRERKEEVNDRLWRLEMADRLVGKERQLWDELSTEKIWLIGEIRQRLATEQG